MLNSIRRFFAGTPAQGNQAAHQIRQRQANIERFDVTAFAGEFDVNWLTPVISAPVWMSRAERLMMFSLAFCLRPQRYLEIGTFQGGSALLVGSALDALKSDGRMYLVDPEPKIAAENWQKIAHRAEMFKGYSPDILQTVAAKAGKPFDLVLIDGDHTYQGARRDATGVLPYVAPGGYILFHDSFFPDVRRAIDEFVDEHSAQVIDFGLLTREITVQASKDNPRVEWGGLRMLYVAG
ncbi:MAG TPA: class I SAM-dependent methyltransferase [Chloroflexi bacterium]|nr:class I SAM-dependent methyltransferase [Chloroflexota bacterium]